MGPNKSDLGASGGGTGGAGWSFAVDELGAVVDVLPAARRARLAAL